jgi:hypothetical protein
MESCSAKSQAIGKSKDAAAINFVEQGCLPLLERAQNDDGGWGFAQGALSRVEPTSWALLARNEFCAAGCGDHSVARGLDFLQNTQLDDGSWPAAPGQETGCWVTSLACLALRVRLQASERVALGLRWLADEWPGDSGLRWRLMRWLAAKDHVLAQNDSYCGWSWTPRTASWVEPTSYALLALRGSPANRLPGIARRLQLAEEMLYDRMCPGGGWNCGNPRVYGVPGEPQVGPTVWALLALRGNSDRSEIKQSLDWLGKNWSQVPSAASLALASIALDVWGRNNPLAGSSLRRLYSSDEIPGSVPVVAWSALAMSTERNWLKLTVATEAS